MKKSILGIFVLGICVLAMSSCKKDYTCECTTTGGPTTTTSSIEITDSKKKDAEDACNGTGASVGTLITTCKLK